MTSFLFTFMCSGLLRLDETWEVEGSLGGLHLLDVTPEGTLYQQVISIGQFQAVDMGPLFSAPPSPSPDMYKTAMDERIFLESFANPAALTKKNACTFVIRKQQRSVDKAVNEFNLYLETMLPVGSQMKYMLCSIFLMITRNLTFCIRLWPLIKEEQSMSQSLCKIHRHSLNKAMLVTF